MRETVLEAVLRSADAPSEAQRNRFAAFLKKQYGEEVPLRWEQDPALEKGFRMEVGADLYDWSLEGRLRQFRERLEQLNPAGVSVIPLMREAVRNWQPDAAPEEVGSVLTVGDEIATVSGLEHAAYGEILQFSSGVKGMVQDLRPDRVGCILFGGSEAIESGSIVRRTGKTAGIPVGDGFLGRVVDALGMPIDGQGDIPSEGYLPIESPAPGIIDRQPVNAPMETGLLAIDSMFPIGRGQRELIIGDRQDRHRPGHRSEPEREGRGVHLCCHRAEIQLRRPTGRESEAQGRYGLYHRGECARQRVGVLAVHRSLCRNSTGRVLHAEGPGRSDRL